MRQDTIVQTIGFLTFLAMMAAEAVLLWVNFGFLHAYGREPFHAALIGFVFAAAYVSVLVMWRCLITSECYKRFAHGVASRLQSE